MNWDIHLDTFVISVYNSYMLYVIITSLFDRPLQSNNEGFLHLPQSRSLGLKLEYLVSLYDILRTESME